MVAVVADSASNVPPQLAAELGITIVPMHLRMGGRTFRDGVDLVGDDFYDRLERDEGPVSTAAASPGDFARAFESAGEREIVCVTVAGSISAMYRSAQLAAEGFDGSVEVVDSTSATMGEGFVAIEAARAAQGGGALAEVASRAREVAGRVDVVACIDTFRFLRRSGRVTALQAYAATMLDIKPVFRFQRGEPAPVGRPRTRARALSRIVEEVVLRSRGRPLHLAGIHARAEDDARRLVERVAARAAIAESFVVAATPAIGAHTGPGLAGLAYWRE